MTKERLHREIIAMRVAREFEDGNVVNLGLGIPTLCSQFVPEGNSVIYHAENGILNYGPMAEEGEEDVLEIQITQFAAPVGHRLGVEDGQRVEPELPHPVGLVLHLRDL